jgi:hypothetical protein
MKNFFILFFLISIICSCSHKSSPNELVVIEGAEFSHEVALDPKTKLIWNHVSLPQSNYGVAEMVCTIALSGGKMSSLDLGMNLKWRLPTKVEFEGVKERGLRHFFRGNVFWTADTAGDSIIVYDKVVDQFMAISHNKQYFDVLCVSEKK